MMMDTDIVYCNDHRCKVSLESDCSSCVVQPASAIIFNTSV